MEVNITLVLIMIQFACVYCFLYKFLFAPASRILDENDQLKKKLYKNIEQEQQAKDILIQEYQTKSNAFKDELIKNIPEQATESSYQKSTFNATLDIIEKVQLSEQDKEKIESFLVDHLSQVIKK
ncbi:MAG: hypothetical protein JO129_00800 [Candidatus Dependentiae bacterium]|nr:hypothetical protein [Candidatus Dependentiae bacterium]